MCRLYDLLVQVKLVCVCRPSESWLGVSVCHTAHVPGSWFAKMNRSVSQFSFSGYPSRSVARSALGLLGLLGLSFLF